MCYVLDNVVLDNVEDIKKICFQYKNISAMVVLLKRYTNVISLKTLFALISL